MSDTGSSPSSDGVSFTGGMSVPLHRSGRANVTTPLVEFTISSDRLTWRVRGLAGTFLDAVSSGVVSVDLDKVACAFPLRGQFLRVGVGFVLDNGSEYYFGTRRHRDAVLREVSKRGIAIAAPRSAFLFRTSRRNP